MFDINTFLIELEKVSNILNCDEDLTYLSVEELEDIKDIQSLALPNKYVNAY